MSAIEIVPVAGKARLKQFIELPKRLYHGHKGYIAPLDMERGEVLTPKKNPYFSHAEVALFLALKNGEPVGRISAQICKLEQERRPGTGHFGWLDAIDDADVYAALVKAAGDWLKSRGMARMVGPLSFSSNEETGLLVEGFDSLPMLMMPYHAAYAGKHVAAAGLGKLKDVVAYDIDEARYKPMGSSRMLQRWQADGTVKLRGLDMKNYTRDLRIILDIFNDAWTENWGFVPATPAEVKKAAADMKLIIDEDLAFIAEIDGKPVGMCIALPNLNEAIRDLKGKLFPFGFAKLLWRVKVKNPKTARLMLLGIRRELRGVKKYGALSMAMYVEIAKRGTAKGYEWGELSWTLEDNHPVNLGIKAMGAKVYKKYRVFEGALT